MIAAKTTGGGLVLGALALFAVACASPPSQRLEEIRARYDRAESDPDISRHASVQLYEAENAVRRLERAAERDRDADLDHLAYLAERHIEIARAAGEAGAFEAKLEELAERRDSARLQARSAEAREAREAAGTLAEEVTRTREQLEQQRREFEERSTAATERAQELESRLEDLQAEETQRGLVLTMRDVLFGFDEAELQPGAENALDEVARFLNEFPERDIAIEGHTDSVGSEEYNRDLSQRRAQAVADYLQRQGVDRSRVKVEGFGERMPVVPNETRAGRQENRRVEIVLRRGDAAEGTASGGSAPVGAGPPAGESAGSAERGSR